MKQHLKRLFWISFLLLLCSWRWDKPSDNINVLLITVDTLRADHLSSYGYPKETSPNLDRLAKEGTRFENVYCQLPATGPSHSSIFTSLYPHGHGVVANGWVLSENHITLTEIFRNRGYETGAFVSSFPVASRFGLVQGFKTYDDKFKAKSSTKQNIQDWEGHKVKNGFDRRADATTDKAIRWLKKNRKKPFFMWVHYFDPHSPFEPPEPYDDMFTSITDNPLRRQIAHYDGEIRFTDGEIQRLLDRIDTLKLREKTLIVITSDHGEGLGQHNWMAHGVYIYEEEMKIPLIINLPGKIPPGKIIATPTQSIDIAPTILSLLGIPIPKEFQGRDLSSWLFSDAGLQEDANIFLERMHYYGKSDYFSETQYLIQQIDGLPLQGEKYGVINKNMKFIWAPGERTEELFNLEDDPEELVNLADESSKVSLDTYKKMVNKWLQENPFSGKQQEMDNETMEKLKALGYIN